MNVLTQQQILSYQENGMSKNLHTVERQINLDARIKPFDISNPTTDRQSLRVAMLPPAPDQ